MQDEENYDNVAVILGHDAQHLPFFHGIDIQGVVLMSTSCFYV